MEPQEMTPVRTFFDRFAAPIFIGFAFLLPLFIIPSTILPFQAGKSSLVFIGTFVFFVWWLIERLKRGSITVSWSLVPLLAYVLAAVYFLSALFSNSVLEGIVGRGFELDTALSMLSFATLLFLAPQIFRAKQSIFNFYIGLFSSFFVVFIFGFIRIVAGPEVFTLGVLTSSVSNLVGSWNDLAVFFGLMTTLALIMLEIVPPRGILRVLLYAGLVLSLLSLVVVNFVTVWIVVAICALALFIYSFAFARSFNVGGATSSTWKDMWRVPRSPLIVLFVALIFVTSGSTFIANRFPALNIGNQVSEALGISQLEARPSWGTTFAIARGTLGTDPFLGSGPNQFVYEWQKYRPQVVNESAFWNVDFNYGIGIIPSSLITLGSVGFLAWIIFIAFFAYQGLRVLRRPKDDLFAYYLSITSFVGATYLWVMAIFYTTSLVPFALAFILSGLFIASISQGGVIREKTLSFTEEPSIRFVALIVTIVIIVASGTALFFVGQNLTAFSYFSGALRGFSQSGNLEAAEVAVRKAIAIQGDDAYYRGLSEIALLNLNRVASQVTPQTPPEQLQEQFKLLLGGAIAASQEAGKVSPNNYENLISLGRTYESVVPLKLAGAYEGAKNAYLEAARLNPTSPAVRLTLARLEILNGNNKDARIYIDEAIKLKSNFTEAIFLLSQIEVSEGNVKAAIKSVESASLLAPNDPTVFFQLGFLEYNDKNFTKAIAALERAVALEPAYANARYFLGLSYDKNKERAKAIAEFETIEKTNPDNQEVKFILNNLRDGRDAFAEVEPPLDSTPEKRPKPPIDEDTEEEEI